MQESSPLRLHSVYQGRLYLIYPIVSYTHMMFQTSTVKLLILCHAICVRMKSMPTVNEACPCLTQAGHGVRMRPTFCRPKGCQVWPIGIHRYPSVILGIPDRFGPTKIHHCLCILKILEDVRHLEEWSWLLKFCSKCWGSIASGIWADGEHWEDWTAFDCMGNPCVYQFLSFSPFGPSRPRSPGGTWGLLESVLCAAGANPASGLHPKHAYSILDVRKAVPSICGIPSWTNQLSGQSAWDTGCSTIGIGSDGMWWVPTFSMMSSRTERCVACRVTMKIFATLEELHFLITYPLVMTNIDMEHDP